MEHDNSYKLLFSHLEIVTDLLQGFVHEPWVKHLDFSTLEKLPTHCVSDDLRDREDDVIWKVKCKDQWLYVYLLIEFQSSVDYFMAVRLMTYIGLLYQDLIKQQKLGKKHKLPPVFPIVLYNGEDRWTAATELSTLIEDLPEKFTKYKPSLSYLVLDEGRYKKEELDPLKNLVAAIFRLENCKSREDVVKVLDDLIAWLHAPEQNSLRRAFNIWIQRVLMKSGKIRKTNSNNHHQPLDLNEVRTMLSETISGWFDEVEQKALKQGMNKGLQKGLQKGRIEKEQEMLDKQRQMFRNMIDKRFNSSVAEEAAILLEKIKTPEAFMQISNWFIECETSEKLLDGIRSLLAQKH